MKKKTAGFLLTGAAAAAAAAVMVGRKRQQQADETDGTGKTVLITGASGGIGKELAFEFARHHLDRKSVV